MRIARRLEVELTEAHLLKALKGGPDKLRELADSLEGAISKALETGRVSDILLERHGINAKLKDGYQALKEGVDLLVKLAEE